MLSAFLLVFAFFALLIIHDRIKYRRIYELLGKFPGPTKLPLIGVAYDFRSIDVIIGSLIKYYKYYGTTLSGWIFRVPIVIISDPNHLKIVLNSDNCLEKEERYRLTQEVLGDGLVAAPGNIWKKNRKLINPVMNQKTLNSFVETFVKHNDLMIEHMEKNVPEKESFDIDSFLMGYVLDILIETGMGIDEELPRPPEFPSDLHRISEILIQRSLQVWLHPNFIFRLSPLGREFYGLINKVQDYFLTLIEKSYKNYHSRDKHELSFDDNKRKPFLDHLLSIENEFSVKQLRDEIIVFLTAGIDTTATSMGYLFVCLGVLKDIQEKVVEELFDVLGDTGRPVCVEDLPKLQYLERVIKETMRIFPSVPLFARSVTEEVDIGEFIIPKGASLIIPTVVTHRNEKLWPDPLKFDPDRFLPSEVAKRPPYSYLPFSAGPRNCIGKQYAMMSMKLMTAYILRKFKIDTDIKLEDIRSNVQIVARIIGGANVSIEKRHKT